jgi:hypothetical protein
VLVGDGEGEMLLTAALDTIGQEENNLKNSTYDQALHVEIF